MKQRSVTLDPALGGERGLHHDATQRSTGAACLHLHHRQSLTTPSLPVEISILSGTVSNAIPVTSELCPDGGDAAFAICARTSFPRDSPTRSSWPCIPTSYDDVTDARDGVSPGLRLSPSMYESAGCSRSQTRSLPSALPRYTAELAWCVCTAVNPSDWSRCTTADDAVVLLLLLRVPPLPPPPLLLLVPSF